MKKKFIIVTITSLLVMMVLPYLTQLLKLGDIAFGIFAISLGAGYPLFSGAAGWYAGKHARNKWDFLIFPAIPSVVFLAGSAICYGWNPAVNIALAIYYFVIGWIAMTASAYRSR